MSQFAYTPIQNEDYRTNNIAEQKFTSWTSDNLYRTSYASSYRDKPHEPKNSVVPGYAGFVPGIKSRTEFGRSFAQIAKSSFNDPDLAKNKHGLSSTGFNLNPKLLADDTLTAGTHKYGSPTVQRTHPSLAPTTYISVTQSTFKNPNNQVPPTYRPSDVKLVNPSWNTRKSGYATNSITFDGIGFLPRETSADPRRETEYRKRFNTEKPIHRETTIFHPRKQNPFSNTFNVEKQK